MNAVAVLFGRAGSKSVPRKNLVHILGRPSCQYPLLAAYASNLVSAIYVSTDDPEIRRMGERYGALYIPRPPELATDDASLGDAIAHAWRHIRANEREPVDELVILQANAPCVLASTIDKAILYRGAGRYDSVVTATELSQYEPGRARTLTAGDCLTMQGEASGQSRGERGPTYFTDGSITVAAPRIIETMADQPGPFPWQGARIGMLRQVPGSGDIDQEWQVHAAAWWLREHGFSRRLTPYGVNARLPKDEAFPVALVRGKRVAVIGRAPYLVGSGLGAEIDAHDIVIRVNWLGVPDALVADVGTRTTISYLSRSMEKRADDMSVRVGRRHRRPLVTALAEKARELLGESAVYHKYEPNSGTMAIFDALDAGAKKVSAYGFDFHTSDHYVDTGAAHARRDGWQARRDGGRVSTHDPDIDRALLAHLMGMDARFRPDARMREILEGSHATA